MCGAAISLLRLPPRNYHGGQVRHRFAPKPLVLALIRPLRGRRRWLYALLASLAVAASVAVPSLQAGADTGTITVNSVSGDGSGNLSVSITSAIPLSGIKVHLWSGPTDVVDLTDFTPQGTFTASTPQTWTLTSPKTDLATLAPGTYSVGVDATDTDADPPVTGLTPADASTFNFIAQPTLTTAPTFNTTRPNQPVSITGQLGCATLSCPVGGWPVTTVTVTDTTANTPAVSGATTDSSGDFTVSGVVGIPGDSYTVAVAAVPSTSLAASATTMDVAQYATTSLSIPATVSAPYGQESITGTLTYATTSGSVPAPPGITITAAAGALQATTTTNANGTFSMTLPAIPGNTTWTVSSQAQLTTTPFLFGATGSVNATQTWPANLSGFSVTLSRFYIVTVGGCLSSSITPAPSPPDLPSNIQIQYELTTAGPWKVLGTVLTSTMPGCGGGSGAAFLASGNAPAAAAYYRAFFPGDNIYQPATGTSIRAAHTATRFNPFRASASILTLPNRRLTIHGTLQYQGPAKWRGYASQRVLLIYCTGSAAHCNNNNNWNAYKWVRTNSLGNFSLTFTDLIGTAFWSANYYGNATHMAAGAPLIKVTLRRSGARVVGSPLPQATPVKPLFTIMPTGQNWQEISGMQFLMVADPLLILMGPQP
jgi:hypothetical protein